MFDGGIVTFLVLEFVPGNDAFNYFFTLISAVGLLSFFCGMIFKILSRS